MRGGARNRSGPPQDPNSIRSAKAGRELRALTPFTGDAPDFPLPDAALRELAVWAEAWRSPQASAWISEPWRWRSVALWVRWSVRMEAEDASAALGNVVVRYADQIGMTPAGLKENGWTIAPAAEERPLAPVAEHPTARRSRDRFKPDAG
jgi:hypothetical protein